MIIFAAYHLGGVAMRAIVMLVLLFVAGTCYAEDPLETLNTVEETLTTMEHTLKARAAEQADPVYFVSDESLGARGWVNARQCSEDGAVSTVPPPPDSCVSQSEERETSGSHFWKSRVALPSDLRPGVVVVAHNDRMDGGWVIAKVTNVAELERGYVEISAPFKGKVGKLRVVEE
jgi:hypothetical protein